MEYKSRDMWIILIVEYVKIGETKLLLPILIVKSLQ